MKHFILVGAVMIVLASCTRDRYYRTQSGLLYQVAVTDTINTLATMGTTAKVNYIQMVNDSVMSTTYDRMPLYHMVMPHMSYYNPLEVFDYGLREGDSIIVTQRIDSMMAKNVFKEKPEWMEMDDKWITRLKVERVFRSDSALQADKRLENERVIALQTALGMGRIKQYFAKNNLTATIHEKMYSQVLVDGIGVPLDSGQRIQLDFEVKTLRGKVINSTIDTTFNNITPREIILGTHMFPPMVEELLMTYKAGTRLMVYTPAVLLFGTNPKAQGVKIDDDISIELIVRE